MRNRHLAALLAASFLTAAGPANGASSEWTKVEGAAVRVVLSAEPDEEGRLRGALQIDLEPGWKTYWLDPGDAGVPPSVAMSVHGAPGAVDIGFPQPAWHDDGYAKWAGYDRPVSFALTLAPPYAGSMDFSVFLGVCETICIPLQASFSVEPDRAAANAGHEAVVEGAFAALPDAPRPGFRVIAARVEGESVAVEAELPADAESAELFLASTQNRMFGAPKPEKHEGRIAFRVPVLSATSDAKATETARYTLVSGGRAVAGTVLVGE